MEIHFGPCPACDKWPAKPLQVQPEWASFAGWSGCVRWLRDSNDQPPVIGQLRTLALSYPFRGRRGEAFWCLWERSDVYEGGYEEHPELLQESRIVEVRMQELLRDHGSCSGGKSILASVKVVRFFSLPELVALPPNRSPGLASLEWFRCVTPSVSAGKWGFAEMDVEGDAGCSIVWIGEDGARHILLEERWGSHESYFFAGHLLAEEGCSTKVLG